MLKFIIGKPASGKTYEAVKIIKERALRKEHSVMIVPEQFTFETERLLLKTIGDSSTLYTSVFSFTRLCDEVGRSAGGIAGTVLSDSDKIIFMSRALKNIGEDLKLWGRYISSVTFAKTMLDTIGEFKINAIMPETLRDTALDTDNLKLKTKLLDIALIYEEYNALVGERFIDPADKLTKLYSTLETCEFFKGKTVIIDSFKGFTGQQYAILDRIIAQAEDIYICFADNTENKREYNLFTNIRTAVNKITKAARRYSVEICEPLILKNSRYNSSGLGVLEEFLSADKSGEITDSSVTLVDCANLFDEAEFTARTIRKTVREEGLRFKDFVIIARDSEPYTEAIATACKRNGVSVFYDKRVPLTAFPGASAVISAINALNMSTENILRFHKTGLGTLNTDEISVLQNFTAVWNIEGEIWLKEWDMNPAGLTTNEGGNSSYGITLEYLNNLRIKAISPIINFKESFKGNAKTRVRAIVELMKHCNFSDKLARLCDDFSANGISFTSDVLKASYDELIKILDSIARCYGESNLNTAKFSDSLNLAVSLASVGVIPQMLDQVTFGSADRIRPSRPKIAFVLGANQGVFPKNIFNNGVFNLNERRLLIEAEIPISDNSVTSAIDEEFLVYSNLCCASDKLYILYSSASVIGVGMEPSSFIENIYENLKPRLITEPQNTIDTANAPETEDSAFTEYCRRVNKPADIMTLEETLKGSNVMQKLETLKNSGRKECGNITPETAKKLFGENIRMSASKFNTFSHCRFSFFCRYGLKVEPLQTAEFNVMQKGTLIHYVLQKLVEDFKEDFEKLKDVDIDLLTDRYINSYLDSVPGYRTVETPRLQFMVSRLSRSLKEVINHICEEIIQSDFKPVSCELKIGNDGEIPTLEFPYGEGNIEITGSIDRVDKYGGYIRIVDYKSGDKVFALSDILVGLNMQMLIYLYAITRGNGKDDSIASGILYQPSSRDLAGKGIAMNGLIIEDSEIASAMDKSGEGKFAPKLNYNNDGSLNYYCTSYIKPEEFTEIFDYIERLMKKTGNKISSGDFAAEPMNGKKSYACSFCEFGAVCGIEGKEPANAPSLRNSKVMEILREGDYDGV